MVRRFFAQSAPLKILADAEGSDTCLDKNGGIACASLYPNMKPSAGSKNYPANTAELIEMIVKHYKALGLKKVHAIKITISLQPAISWNAQST
ncbi:hypothetical protein MCHI_002739 [Candidatus Magnetoovum chiemensis]|nr:hypothetical protein MCHI_002739 [Candidatus Magnetoovum chiemensis]